MTDINREEAKQAKRDGAGLVKNSGRGINKGDAKTDTLLIDYKFTESKSFSLNIEKFRKHELDAYKLGIEACIVVIYQNHRNRKIAMVDWDYLQELEEAAAK